MPRRSSSPRSSSETRHAHRARRDRARRDRARARGHRRASPTSRSPAASTDEVDDHPRPDRASRRTGIGYPQIQAALAASSVTIPAGELPSDDESIPVTVIGEIASTDELEAIVVGVNPTGASRRPRSPSASVADGRDRWRSPRTGYARINGQEALGLTVSKTASANTVEVSQAVNEALDEIVADSEADLEIDERLRPGRLHHRVPRRAAARGRPRRALRRPHDLRLPLQPALDVRRRDEHPALAARRARPDAGHRDHDEHHDPRRPGGRRRSRGRRLDRRAREHLSPPRDGRGSPHRRRCSGTSEVAGAITWSTLTTVAVFLPLGFAGGLHQPVLPALRADGQLRAPRVAGRRAHRRAGPRATSSSASRRGDVDAEGEPKRSIWVRLYDPTIRAVLRSRWTAHRHRLRRARCSSSARCSSCRCCRPRSSTRARRRSCSSASLRRPAPARRRSSRRAIEAEAILLADDEVELVQTERAAGGRHRLPDPDLGPGRPRRRTRPRCSSASTTRRTSRPRRSPRGGARARSRPMAGMRSSSRTPARPPGGNLALVVGGPDLDAVEAGDRDRDRRASSDDRGLANVTSDLVAAAPQVEVVVDADRAAAAGVSAGQVGGVVRGVLTPTSVTTIQPEDADEPVARRCSASIPSTDRLGRGARRPAGGPGATLGDVADIEEVEARATISRVNGDSVGDGDRRDHRRGHRRRLRRRRRRARAARGLRRSAGGRHRRRSAA